MFYDGSGNFVTDEVTVTVVDTTASTITSAPADASYEYGTSSYVLSWTATDLDPATYTVYVDDVQQVSGSWSSGVAVPYDAGGLALGTHNITIVFYDGSGNFATDEVTVTVVDTTEPVITSAPADGSYEYGTSSYVLNWTAMDLDPTTYQIYVDNTLQMSSNWNNSSEVVFEAGGLSVGTHNITIVFYDGSGNKASDEVIITVVDTTAPIIVVRPSNMSFEEGTTGHWANWTAEDLRPDLYLIEVNGTSVKNGTWNSGEPVTFLLDDFTAETYILTITFYDRSGNSVTDEIIVIVTAPIADDPPVIKNVIVKPRFPKENESFAIFAIVTDDHGVSSVKLHFKINDDASWQIVQMEKVNGTFWKAEFSGYPRNTVFRYYVEAIDTRNQSTTSSEQLILIGKKVARTPGYTVDSTLLALILLMSTAALVKYQRKRTKK